MSFLVFWAIISSLIVLHKLEIDQFYSANRAKLSLAFSNTQAIKSINLHAFPDRQNSE